MTYIPKGVTARLKAETKKFQKILPQAIDRDVNESDTVAIISDMFADIFGYDKYTDLTSEFAIKSTYCDLAIQVDGSVQFLVEAKAIGLDLKENHINQAIGYGAQHGIQWVVLTNGKTWEIYRINFGQPITTELLTSYNFLEINTRKTADLETLFLLCKEGLSKDAIEGYYDHVQGVNKHVIGALMLSEAGIKFLARELKRTTPGLQVQDDEVETILRGEVLKRDLLDGIGFDEAIKRVKKAASRKMVKRV